MTYRIPNVPFEDLSNFSNIPDYKSTNKKTYTGVLEYLDTNGFKYFLHLINKSTLSQRYLQEEQMYTLCIPKDDSLCDAEKSLIQNADTYVANTILQYSTLDACLDKKDILGYNGYGLPTNIRNMSILVSAKNGMVLLGNSVVIGIQEHFKNKNILVLDRLLIPPHVM
jgi:hypothetical protein